MRLALIIVTIILSASAFAQTTVGGHVACLDKDDFDTIRDTAVRGDKALGTRVIQRLLDSERCVILERGLAVSILDRSWLGPTKARVFTRDGDSFVVYAQAQAFTR